MSRLPIFSFLFLFLFCSQNQVSNICDSDDPEFITSLLFRIFTKDSSSTCGYNLDLKTACNIDFTETTDTKNWKKVQSEILSQFRLGSRAAESLVQFTTDTPLSLVGNGTTAFQGILNAPDKSLYYIPYNATSLVSVNPQTNTVQVIASAPGSVSFLGGILGPKERIYLAPHVDNIFKYFDLSNKSYVNLGTDSTLAASAYSGGILAPNGKVYFTPNGETKVSFYDTKTGSLGSLNTLLGAGFSSATLAPNGKIYYTPLDATRIKVLNTIDETISELDFTFSGSGDYISAVLGPDERIYLIPFNETIIRYIDLKTETVKELGPHNVSLQPPFFNGAVLAPNGKIYLVPLNSTDFVTIDINTSEIKSLSFGNPSSSSYRGAGLFSNGDIYLSPHGSNRFDLIRTNSIGTFCEPLLQSSYWNKL